MTTRPYRCDDASSSDMPPTVDDDRFPGQVVGFENEEHRARDVLGTPFTREGRRAPKSRGVLLTPALREQYRAGCDRRDAHLRREHGGERAGDVDDTRLRDTVRDVSGPRLERGKIGDVHDDTARLAKMRCGGLRQKKRRAQIQIDRLIPASCVDFAERHAHHDGGRVHENVDAAKAAVSYTHLTLPTSDL